MVIDTLGHISYPEEWNLGTGTSYDTICCSCQ